MFSGTDLSLGNPPPNSVKFFAALEVLEQVKDRMCLAKLTNALNQHWQARNATRKTRLQRTDADAERFAEL
jgi:hypothetical protein